MTPGAAKILPPSRHTRVLRRAARIAPPLGIFAVNVWICWRLFHTEYLDEMLSIAGTFMSLERYIEAHWPLYDWFPWWYSGYPFWRSYQPLFHFTVAAVSSVTHASIPHVYHFLAALEYSLGGVAFYMLVRALTGSRAAAFCGGMLYSTFSLSVLIPGISGQLGSFRNARRLQALVVWGEAPNTTGLMLGLFALAALHAAMRRRTPGSAILAALALAAVPATNWPSTVALTLALASYLVAIAWNDLPRSLPRFALICALSAAFVLPLALPDDVIASFANSNAFVETPTTGAPRWIALGVIVLAFVLARLLLNRAPFGIRFASLYSILTGGIVLPAVVANVRLTPTPMRFHLAFEIALTLLVTLALWKLSAFRPRLARPLFALAIALTLIQAWHYRKFARSIIQPTDVRKTVEYREAMWFDRNAQGERIEAPGSVSLWMNLFTDTPQLTGAFDPSVLSRENMIAAYVTAAGFQTDQQSADYTRLWLEACAVADYAIGGPASREYYHPFLFPNRFRGRLPLVWQEGDDYIYRVPERVSGLARVVRAGDIVRHAPQNGIDVKELRPFVAALDDPSLPVASATWSSANEGHIRARLQTGQVISLAINFHSGWRATENGRAAVVRPDGLGLIVIEPHCDGDCAIDVRWSPGAQPWTCVAVSFAAFAGSLAWL